MCLIVGLGNPGSQYSKTRHNIGYLVIDELSARWGIDVDKKKFDGRCGSGHIAGCQALLLKPETFMNNSGISVRAAMDFYKLQPTDLLVIFDDMAIPVGQIRVRSQGSAGGHNGLSSVILHAGTENFGRVRVGIGTPPLHCDAVQYVLGEFRSDERVKIDLAIKQASDAVELILTAGYDKAMVRYNKKVEEIDKDKKLKE